MSTKAQAARVEAQRNAHPPKPKQIKGRSALPQQPPRRSKGQLPAAEAMAEAAAELDGLPTPGTKQPGSHTEKRATVKIEASASGQTSRKSTRASANRVKNDTQLTRRTQSDLRAPKTRAAKAVAARATRAGAKRV